MAKVLLINFNRPDKTEKVIKPIENCEELFLFCDGPKTKIEEKIVGEVKKILCSTKDKRDQKGLKTYLLFLEKNYGSAQGPLHAIQWFFNQVEEGHVIEDDILVHPQWLAYHEKILQEKKNSQYLWIGCGHPLPKSPFAFIETKICKLIAWSSWKNKIQPILKELNEKKQNPWETQGLTLLKPLPIKTQLFLHKEFWRLKQNPNWSWYYRFLQQQLKTKKLGLTATARLHNNLGIDGSGHNCKNLFGEKEEWNEKELEKLAQKPLIGIDKKSEKKLEWERHGRIHQMLGRIFIKILPINKYLK